MADSTIDTISGKLTFDPTNVSIDDVTSGYGTIIWNVVSGTMTFSLNVSGEFGGGDLITICATALQTNTESQFALAIDKWVSGSVFGATVKNYLLGDVDKGFGVKPSDAMETLRFALGLTMFGAVDTVIADVNNALDVTTADALNISYIFIGIAPQSK